MIIKKITNYLPMLQSISLLLVSIISNAGTMNNNDFSHPLYFGASYGFGATTWEGLVPTEQNQNIAIGMSTPIHVSEGGQVWGAFLGYELLPYFALEANYMSYPEATVFFDSMSLFSFNHDDMTEFNTKTEAFSLMGKIMFFIPHTKLRLFSSIGAAEVHREDLLMNHWRLSPTFGAGMNYNFTDRVMAELNGNYTAGYGESQLEPSVTYFPFLYSVSLRLAYRF